MLHDGTLAGSSINLHMALVKAVQFGVPLEQAVAAVRANPAKTVSAPLKKASERADCVLLDSELNISGVFLNGVLHHGQLNV